MENTIINVTNIYVVHTFNVTLYATWYKQFCPAAGPCPLKCNMVQISLTSSPS